MSSTQTTKPSIPSQKQNTGGTPDEPVTTRLLSSETPNFVKEAEVLTRCNTPIQEVPVPSDKAGDGLESLSIAVPQPVMHQIFWRCLNHLREL